MGKAIAFGILAVIAIGVMIAIHYGTELDEANRDLEEARREVAMIDGGLATQRRVLEWRKELAALITASTIIEKEVRATQDELRELDQRMNRVADAFLRAVDRVRAETAGLVVDSLPLSNGRVLTRARIQALNLDSMTIMHSEGISQVRLEDLPDNLKERLRIGMPTFGNETKPTPPSSSSVRPRYTASDNAAMLGQNAQEFEKEEKAKLAAAKSAKPNTAVEGDPALWKSVKKTSLGRAYIPGQGWLSVGPNGPIPGSARN